MSDCKKELRKSVSIEQFAPSKKRVRIEHEDNWGEFNRFYSLGEALDSLPRDVLGDILGFAAEFEYRKLLILGSVCKAWKELIISQVKVVTVNMWHHEYACTSVCQFLESYSGSIQTVKIEGIRCRQETLDWKPLLQTLLKCRYLQNLTVRDSVWQVEDDPVAAAVFEKLVTLRLQYSWPRRPSELSIASPHLRTLEIEDFFSEDGVLNLVGIQSLDCLHINDGKLIMVNAVNLLHVGMFSIGYYSSEELRFSAPKLKGIFTFQPNLSLREIIKDVQNVQVNTLRVNYPADDLIREIWPCLHVPKLVFNVGTSGYTGQIIRWIKWFERNNKSLVKVVMNIGINTKANRTLSRVLAKSLKRARLTVTGLE